MGERAAGRAASGVARAGIDGDAGGGAADVGWFPAFSAQVGVYTVAARAGGTGVVMAACGHCVADPRNPDAPGRSSGTAVERQSAGGAAATGASAVVAAARTGA